MLETTLYPSKYELVYKHHIILFAFSMDTVVLGGTHQENDYNTKPTPEDKKFIMEGCQKIVPGLKHAEHLRDWVGLRPGRTELRLEAEEHG